MRAAFPILLPDDREAVLVVTAIDSDGAVGGWDVEIGGAEVDVPREWWGALTDEAQERVTAAIEHPGFEGF